MRAFDARGVAKVDILAVGPRRPSVWTTEAGLFRMNGAIGFDLTWGISLSVAYIRRRMPATAMVGLCVISSARRSAVSGFHIARSCANQSTY